MNVSCRQARTEELLTLLQMQIITERLKLIVPEILKKYTVTQLEPLKMYFNMYIIYPIRDIQIFTFK